MNLRKIFIQDCTEKGHTRKEAEKLYRLKGVEFIEEMVSNMWLQWNHKFPVEDKKDFKKE